MDCNNILNSLPPPYTHALSKVAWQFFPSGLESGCPGLGSGMAFWPALAHAECGQSDGVWVPCLRGMVESSLSAYHHHVNKRGPDENPCRGKPSCSILGHPRPTSNQPNPKHLRQPRWDQQSYLPMRLLTINALSPARPNELPSCPTDWWAMIDGVREICYAVIANKTCTAHLGWSG